MAVSLQHYFSVCASVISYVAFVLSLFVPYVSFLWCLGEAVLRDCGISAKFSLLCRRKYETELRSRYE